MRTSVAILIAASASAIVAAAAGLSPQAPAPAGRGVFPGNPVFAALDADNDGTVAPAELSAAPKALLTLDRDRDGRLTADELAPAFGRGGRRGGFGGDRGEGREGREGRNERGGDSTSTAPDDLADTLMAFDRNADGRLERTEVPERFQGLFDRADGNKDGVLTRDELRQSAASNENARGAGRGEGEGRGGFRDPAFTALDTDRDGVVSAAEITKAATALRVLDANGDGALSAAEFMPAFGRGGRGGRGFGGR